MAIRRAGPWASPTNSYLDTPTEIPPFSFFRVAPVNCALNNWSSDAWIALAYIDGNPNTTDVVGLSEELSSTAVDGLGAAVSIQFYYQAVEDFTANFNWSIDTVSGGTYSYTQRRIESTGTSSGGSSILTPVDSGTVPLVLQASTLGHVVFQIDNIGSGFDADNVTLSVTAP